MKPGLLAIAALIGGSVPIAAMKIDISLQDIERALVIARSRDSERAAFHAKYTQAVETPFLERAEVVTEFRRVVLLAEERIARGDRSFGYSITRANEALKVFRRRVAILARVRFHPQNNYIDVPPVMIAADGHDRALIGVRREPVLAMASGKPGDAIPVLGAVIEGVFDADALGSAKREFVVTLEKKELGRVMFDLGAIE